MNSHILEQAEKIIYTVVLFTGFFIWPFIARRISEEARRIVCLLACWLEVKFPKTKAKWRDDVVPVWQNAVILIGEIMFCFLLTEWIWIHLS